MFTYIETGTSQWMITMQKYANIMRDKWFVKEKDYINYFIEQE